MGRPLNKGLIAKITANANVNDMSSEIPGTVLEQVANNTFVVETVDGKAPCKLTVFPPNPGEMRIKAFDHLGGTYYVMHAGDKTMRVWQDTGTLVPNGAEVPWSTGDANPYRLQMDNEDRPSGEGWFSLFGTLDSAEKDIYNYTGQVAYDGAGNLYLLSGDDSNGKAYLAKYTPAGTVDWQVEIFAGNSDFLWASCVITDDEDNPVVMVTNDQYNTFNRGPVLMRFSPVDGTLLVQRQAHPDPNDTLSSVTFWGESLVCDKSDGSIYLAGWYDSTEKQGHTVLIKYDANLSMVWERGLTAADVVQDDYTTGVALTSDGNVWVTFSGLNTVIGASRSLVAQFEPNGNLGMTNSWFYTSPGGGQIGNSYTYDIVSDSDDNLIVVGGVSIDVDATTVTKINGANAQPQWMAGYWNDDYNLSMYGVVTDGTDIYISGDKQSDVEQNSFTQIGIMKLDGAEGAPVWSRGFGTDTNDTYSWYYTSRCLDIHDGKIAAGGYTYVGDTGYSNALVVTTNTNGNPVGTYDGWTLGGFSFNALPIGFDTDSSGISISSFNVSVNVGNLTVQGSSQGWVTTLMS